MKRIWVEAIAPQGSWVDPDPQEMHHLIRVRRVSEGETVELIDGAGGLAQGLVHLLGKQRLRIKVTERLEQERESRLHLDLVLAIPSHAATIDLVLPGLVQLGVRRIFLTPTAYSGHLKKDRGKYLSRLRQIGIQALKQSGRLVLPTIHLDSAWDDLCGHMAQTNQVNILFHPRPGFSQNHGSPAHGSPAQGSPAQGSPARDLPAQPSTMGIFIGPEGGFTEDEVSRAEGAGICVRGLGSRILKLETAAIGACFWAQKQFGDLC